MMNTLSEMFSKSTDAVFGIDAMGRIQFVNNKFEKLLGYLRNQLCGASCAEVLCGVDIHGAAFCSSNCPIPKMVADQPLFSDFDLVIKRADGTSVLVNIGASYMSQPTDKKARKVNVIFNMRQVNPQRMLKRMAMPQCNESIYSKTLSRLTARENEILDLAVKGMTTAEIAQHLYVSTQTVRSHFKNIHTKLKVNSRTEAVVLAIKQQMC